MEDLKDKIVEIELFGEKCQVDLTDIDISVFEILEDFENVKIETVSDIVKRAKQIDVFMTEFFGEKYEKLMQGRKRSIKTYTEIATALQNAMENLKQ